jgi:hypothetical protein
MLRERFRASSIVSPVTNCSPMRRIASSTPWRMIGSPKRPISRVSVALSPRSSTVELSLPVTNNPHVAALTKSDRSPPRCAFHSPAAIFSRMRALRVELSGMRSSASARHIKAMPSWLESENSCTSAAMPELLPLARSAATRVCADLRMAAASASGNDAASRSGAMHSCSGRRQARVIAWRNSSCARIGGAKASNGPRVVMA